LRRWLKRLLFVVVAALPILAFGVVPYLLSGFFTVRSFQMRDAENEALTPASFKLAFEDVSFQARDGVPLSGWWVPAENAKGTVVLVHGLNRSRVEMVKKCPFVHDQGWNALLFDLRRHGKSGGTVRSLGYHERLDVLGAYDLARKRTPGPVVAWGISFGGAASTLAAAEEPGIAALVCDSSYRSLKDTAYLHLNLFRRFAWWVRPVPVWPTADIAVFWMGRRAHFDPAKLDIVEAASHLSGRPALFVADSADERMPQDIAFDLKAAAGPKAEVLVIQAERRIRDYQNGKPRYESGHGHAYRDGQAQYEHAVAGILEQVAAR
jgi:alpha-beta hydrolase superfamily lysophospholipase